MAHLDNLLNDLHFLANLGALRTYYVHWRKKVENLHLLLNLHYLDLALLDDLDFLKDYDEDLL